MNPIQSLKVTSKGIGYDTEILINGEQQNNITGLEMLFRAGEIPSIKITKIFNPINIKIIEPKKWEITLENEPVLTTKQIKVIGKKEDKLKADPFLLALFRTFSKG